MDPEPPQKPSPLLLPLSPAWRSTSPSLGPRKGLYAGRRLETDPPTHSSSPLLKPAPLSPAPLSPAPLSPAPLSPRIEEPSPLSPRRGKNGEDIIDNSRNTRRGSGAEFQKQLMKIISKRDDLHESNSDGDDSNRKSTKPHSPNSSSLSNSPSNVSPLSLSSSSLPPVQSTKFKPMIRMDSFGPNAEIKIQAQDANNNNNNNSHNSKMLSTYMSLYLGEEPAQVKKLREEVRSDVMDLIRQRKLHPLEKIATFYMKDSSKNAKYSKTYIRLSKNQQVIQFGAPETVFADDSREPYFPLKIQVSNISLVEDHSARELGHSAEAIPTGFHIWFFDKVHREGWDLITSYEVDFQNWFEGLKALIGNGVDGADAPTVKLLSDVEIDLRLYKLELIENKQYATPPRPKPLPPTDVKPITKEKGKDAGWEHWRLCYAEVEAEDCFDFATAQHPLFISSL